MEKNQEPARGGPSGASLKIPDGRPRAGALPRPEDLEDTARLLELRRQAIGRG